MATGAEKEGLSTEAVTPQFLQRVFDVSCANSSIPYCYTTDESDLVCFWESDLMDNSSYTFQYEYDGQVKSCKLETEVASSHSFWYICNFPTSDVISFSPIQIFVNGSRTLHEKSIYTDQVVFLEPPRNVTVKESNTPRVYIVSWETPIKRFDDSITYQVSCGSLEGVEQMTEVPGATERNEVILTQFETNTQYSIRVRAKMNGLTYNGYWSEWTQPVIIRTDFDPFYIVLFVFIAMLVIFVTLFLLLKYIRVIKHLVWPQVPTPESHFQDLFTIHRGNFKLWLGQADFYLMWISRHIFYEDPYSTLEVLSEVPSATSQSSPGQLSSKDNYVILNDSIIPQLPLRMEPGRNQHFSWAEKKMEINTFRPHNEKTSKIETILVRHDWVETESSGTSHTESGFVETPVMESSLDDGSKCESELVRTTVEDDWLKMPCVENFCSEGGKQSPVSSFEYTVVETCDGLLSPKPRPPPTSPPSLKYAYLLMSKSGEESRPPSPNFYQNDQFIPPVYSQC
uniref:Erythropoietin receptor n=1 Tax=Leptobrachium leishanense TaxID=445787 RepID=A0A8C5QB89_9ANUR